MQAVPSHGDEGVTSISRPGPFYHIEGRKLPSVGMVMSVLSKPALVDWKVKRAVQMVLDEPERFTSPEAGLEGLKEDTGALERGEAVHELAEDYANNVYGREDGGQRSRYAENPYLPLVEGFFEFYRPKIVLTEAVLYNATLGYAGTCDLVAQIGPEARTYLVDYKTSRGVYDEHRLQLAAYAGAEHVYNADGTPAPMPEIQRTAIMLLNPGGTTGLVEIHRSMLEYARDFAAFKGLLDVWKWREDRRNSVA